jgi:hypothetical protein
MSGSIVGVERQRSTSISARGGTCLSGYRDAVRFDNGREVLLQKFEPGQRAVVLRLALAEEVADPEIAYAGVF